MEKPVRPQHGLGSMPEGEQQIVPSSPAGGSSSAQLMLLQAAIDGDLRLLKEMVVCLDKGQGEAATVAAVSYRGIGALHMATHMGRMPVVEYLKRDLGLHVAEFNDSTVHIGELLLPRGYIEDVIHDIKSVFLQAQGGDIGVLMQKNLSISTLTPTVSWEDLPPDVVYNVACTFLSAEVYIKVRSVCRKWAAALRASPPPSALRSRQIPFLLLPPLDPSKPYSFWKLRNRDSPARDVSYLPGLSCTLGHVVVGSSFGWIFVLNPDTLSLFLLNPITGERIILPSLFSLHWEPVDPSILVRHAILSSDPCTSSCWMVLIFLSTDDSSCFSYQYRNNGWTQHVHQEHVIEDVLYFVDRFVALTGDDMLGLFDIDSPDPQIHFVRFSEYLSRGSRHLALGSEQELLLVTSSDFDVQQVTPGHRPLIERLFISSCYVRRQKLSSSGAIFLGHGCSVTVDLNRLSSSVHGGVFQTRTYLRLMGSRGSMRYGGVIRTPLDTFQSVHDILHIQVICDEDDLWLTWKPWWVTPNIFRVSGIPRQANGLKREVAH